MSKFYGKFDIFPTDLRIILSRQTFTHFFKSRSKKFATFMFKTRGGGGVKGSKNNVKKTALLVFDGFPKTEQLDDIFSMNPAQFLFWRHLWFMDTIEKL